MNSGVRSDNRELLLDGGSCVDARALDRLLQDGFIMIRSRGAIPRHLSASCDEGAAFFQLSLAEKMRNRLPYDAGYRPLRSEYSRSPEHPDEVESFNVSHRIGVPIGASLSDHGMRLHKEMLGLFDAIEPIAEAVTILLAECFGVEDRLKFEGAFRLSSVLQMNFSRPSETTAEFINELHEDGCLLTITAVTAPGLEIRDPTGSFIPVNPSHGTLLIMPGEIFYLLTGGAIQPVFHRVRPTANSAHRISLLFFADPHPKLCAPWITNEKNANIDIGSRVLKNAARFGLSEWTLAQFS